MHCPRCHRTYAQGITYCADDGARLTDTLGLEEDGGRPSLTTLRTPVLAGRYELGSLIGHGAMARVYRARDREDGSEVAVKILAVRYATDRREHERFFREAGAAVRIDHPNVVKVRDVGRREADGRPYLVVELLRGEPLGDILRRQGTIDAPHLLPLIRDAAAGLAAAHEAGIVHRDIKPDNLFLVDRGDGTPSAKIVDFGLAKLHTHASSQSGTALGTAAYMPPEQVLSEEVDARADVYALGVVTFRALTGHLPFDGDTDLDLLAHQLFNAAPPPSWIAHGLPPEVDALVVRALRKRPENRYPDMGAMLADLDALLAGRPVAASPPPMLPDLYVPRSDLARDAARLFCRRLGAPLPPFLAG